MADSPSLSRRRFLTGSRPKEPFRPLPPWVSPATAAQCTGCGACVSACPTGIVSLAGGNLGLDFTFGECTFCGACAEACPEPVFDQKRPAPALRHVIEIGENCLPRSGVVCQSCRDACPEQAIRFAPRIGGPFLPVLNESLCTGCGACVAPCPVAAIDATPRREKAHA